MNRLGFISPFVSCALFLGVTAYGAEKSVATLGQSRAEIIAILGAPSPEPPGKMIYGTPTPGEETITYFTAIPPRLFTLSEGMCVGLNYFSLSGDEQEIRALLELHANGQPIIKLSDGVWKCAIPPWQARLHRSPDGKARLVFDRWHNNPQ